MNNIDNHKRTLGIIYIVTSVLTAVSVFFITALISFVLHLIFDQAGDDGKEFVNLILTLSSFIPFLVITFMVLPSLIAGIGLLARQDWALTFAMIVGVLKLFSFPVGTAIGIYAIWVFFEDRKLRDYNTVQR